LGSLFCFAGEFLPNFRPEKYGFNLCRGFIMVKNDTNSPDFEEKKFQIARFL
jgi:hypothetical protein